MRTNYHTHTSRCRHASGSLADYCREAVANGVRILGFSDHCPHPDGLWQSVRMDYAELDDYFRDIRQVREEFPQLKIHAALECEFRPELGNFQKEKFLQTPGRCEYLVLGQHAYISSEGDWHSAWNMKLDKAIHEYTDFVIRAMDSGIYSIVAHPDLMFYTGYPWNAEARDCSRALISAAIGHDLPLEINCNGIRKPKVLDRDQVLRHPYPYCNFWAMAAEMGAKVIIGSDAHAPEEVWCRENNIAENFVEFFDLKKLEIIDLDKSLENL